jgi:phage tail protein X
MSDDETLHDELDRLTAAIVPFICERTSLSSAQVEAVLEANNDFWDSQPSVLQRLVILALPDEDDETNV